MMHVSRFALQSQMAWGLAFLILVVGIAPAQADSLFETYFSKAAGGRPCYARQYTAGHLAKHPRQQVVAIRLDFQPANPDGVPNTAKSFDLGVGVRRRGSTAWFTNSAYCSAQGGDRFECALEDDGGEFRLRPAPGGRLLLENARGTMGFRGETGSFEFGGSSDDNVFLLFPADRRVCDAATTEDR